MKTLNKISGTISKAVNDTDSSSSLETKLKAADLEIQQYITALTSENLTLQRKLAKCEAQKITLKNRIIILEHELDEEKEKPQLLDYIKKIQKERSNK